MTTAIAPNDYAIPEQLRNASLPDLTALLKDQRARALDVVVPSTKLAVCDGLLVVDGTEAVIDDEGVTPTDGVYRPTASFDAQMARALNIDLRYLRRCRATRPDIYDAQINLWLHGSDPTTGRHGDPATADNSYPPLDRKYLLRIVRGGDDTNGVARALLSSKYRKIDNYDVMLAVLGGIRSARDEHGQPVDAQVVSADLTETRMHMRVAAPQIAMLAPELLKNYRSPFEGGAVRVGNGGWSLDDARAAAAAEGLGYAPGSEPVVFAGFSLTNSDLGHGRWSLKPVIVVRICKNGLTLTTEAVEKTHLGGELDEGTVDWSHDTHRKYMELIKGQTIDAVSQWLSKPYLREKVTELETIAGVPLSKPEETIKFVASELSFSEAEADEILKHFYMGGQMTAGGVMQAVSSVAQTVQDGEAARDMEFAAVKAGKLAASRS